MYLAIDYGKKRIGLAIGAVIPRGAGVLQTSKDSLVNTKEISRICKENGITKIIIGEPVRSQGEKGTISDEIDQFAEELKSETGLEVLHEPEQFTSSEAEKNLKERNIKYTFNDGQVDQEAAILILEQYINSQNKK